MKYRDVTITHHVRAVVGKFFAKKTRKEKAIRTPAEKKRQKGKKL